MKMFEENKIKIQTKNQTPFNLSLNRGEL